VVMRLINSLYFRVGTELSEKHYKTYGVTTLKKSHLTIGKKGRLEFNFVGKSHVQHRKVLVDEGLSAVVAQLFAIKRGKRLFRYIDVDGKVRTITPAEINRYLKNATTPEFSAKDFRTWGGTLMAATELAEIGKTEAEKEIDKNIVKAVKKVAEVLGNTPSVCRGSYIHPLILESYRNGVTIEEFRPRRARVLKSIQTDIDPEERALLKMFKSMHS
jgi:DNA topoisomerase-1